MAKKRKTQKDRRGLQIITTCISTAMVLVLVGMVVFSVLTAHNLSQYVKENFVITLTLEDGLTKQETSQLTKTLEKKVYISHLDYISKQQALKEQIKAMGSDPTEFIGANPFMASIELYLSSDYANTDSLVWIQKELKKHPKVSEITYQKDLMESVNSNLKRINMLLLALAVLLTIVSFSLINNTVRLGIYAQRFNIHMMKLVGASWGFIRRPFTNQGLLIGLIAAVVANLILAAGMYALYVYEPDILIVVTWQVMAITGGSVLLFGLVLTWLCTYVSVSKFLRMSAGELYKI